MKTTFLISLLVAASAGYAQDVTTLPLDKYRPESVYKIPVTRIGKAKYPVIDMHSHDYAKSDQEIDTWVRTMDSCGIEKTIILSGATGARFDSVVDKYSRYGKRFEIWCGFPIEGYKESGWSEKAVKELE